MKKLNLRIFCIFCVKLFVLNISYGLSSYSMNEENISSAFSSGTNKKNIENDVHPYKVFLDIYSYCSEHNKSFNLFKLIHNLNNLNNDYYFRKNIVDLGLPESLFFEPLWQCFRRENILSRQEVLNFVGDNLSIITEKKEEYIPREANYSLIDSVRGYLPLLSSEYLHKRK